MMEIPKTLNDDIIAYCKANSIPDIDGFIIKLIKRGFTSEKFGAVPVIETKTDIPTPPENKEPSIEVITKKEDKKDIYGE